MSNLTQRPTLLTRKDLTVVEILNEKAKATSPERAVDYVEFTDSLINSELEQIKQAKKELSLLEANLKSEQERIKIGAAQWLDSMGIDALNGLRVSSMTKYVPAPKEELIIHDESWLMGDKEFVIKTLDKTAVKKWLREEKLDYSEFVELKITHKEPMAKINRRKA